MNVIYPRVDAIRGEQRLDPNAPIVPAYLGGQPVMLARLDPATRPPGMPIDYTVPISVSRLRRAIDIERGYDTGPFEPSLVDDVSLMTTGLRGLETLLPKGGALEGFLLAAWPFALSAGAGAAWAAASGEKIRSGATAAFVAGTVGGLFGLWLRGSSL